MNVVCKPVKEVFKATDSDFRVISCVPIGQAPNELTLSRWGNFTLSGSNLSTFNLYEEYPIEIRPDIRSKYEGSYIVVGFQGIEIGENITVDPELELKFLKGIMSEGQAQNIHNAYPNFIEMILNNREAEIDHNKIYNVGPVYLEKYIDNIKASYKSIFFMGLASDWEIKGDARIERLMQEYNTPNEATQALQTNPYRVLIDVVQYSFDTADAKILQKMPDMIDSKHRCEYACLRVLRDNETQDGETRLNANVLSRMVKNLVPEAYHHTFEVVTANDLLHYDEATKWVSIRRTYEHEKFIAQEILRRTNKIESCGMDWERFRNVDGFECTDEQVEILRLADEYGIALLTGGGGVGKTSAMVALIKMLEHYMKSYTILAPTGIAAKRITQATGRQASTIHMFLARLDGSHCGSDYVIIDEMSMVGVELFATLLSVIPRSKIIMVGDDAQLASISCGNVLHDIINSGAVPRANLTKVFRYGIGGISTVATDIRNGKPYLDSSGNPIFNAKVNDYKCIPIQSKAEKALPQILDTYEQLLDQGYKPSEIMVLSPYNVREAGTYRINEAIQTRFNEHEYTPISYNKSKDVEIRFKVGDKVVNGKNNYYSNIIEQGDEGLYFTGVQTLIANGDIGVIRDCLYDEELGHYLVIQYDEHLIGVTGKEVEDLLLGYSLSIHKCVSGDTLIYTDKGIKPIADLENNWQNHKVYNGNYFESPSGFFKNPSYKCLTIKTTRGIELTGLLDHGVDVINKDGYIERRNLEEVQLDDSIVVAKNTHVYGQYLHTLTLVKEEPGDVRESLYNTPTKMSPSLAEFLGLMCADGTVYKAGFRLCKRHKEVSDRFEELCVSLFGANCKRYVLSVGEGVDTYYCEVNSTYLSRWLQQIDGIHPNNKHVPQVVLSSNKECQYAFLRGVFEDGTVNLKEGRFDHVELATKEEKMAKQIQIMLLNMGIISTRKTKVPRDCSVIYIYKSHIEGFLSNIGFISHSKQGALNSAKKSSKRSSERHRIPNIGKVCREIMKECSHLIFSKENQSVRYSVKTDNDLTYRCLGRFIETCLQNNVNSNKLDYLRFVYNYTDIQKVESIMEKETETYCLEMPETHRFVQNGIYGWNCQGTQSKAVILVTHHTHRANINRNLLYVGVSRAQEQLIQISDINGIEIGLEVLANERETWLEDMLREIKL